ncbi:MAG: LLM class flavin-dependent oxidoreductase [Frankiaceae bacterium]|nr:LLM class flavin-dependent oxidoreductase [Frankiaceae bacterium]MBV9870764.1 LLM class flavin-dependent oxidoreductase [Frankiaceae bacterium]
MTSQPFAAGSISLRLYPHDDRPAAEIIAVMREQAALGAAAGFDGVMTSEHHGGFRGYLPNPIQAAGWALEAMPSGWAAPCPLLLPLRPTSLVVEEIAWLAARFPGRIGLGVAAGSLEQDFTIMGLDKTDLTRRFADGLATVTAALSGRDGGPLSADPAVRRCATHPVPVLSAAMSAVACRRAADLGAGLLIDSLAPLPRCRELADRFRDAGGTAPVSLVRRVSIGGRSNVQHDAQVDVYRTYSAPAAQAHWSESQLISGCAAAVADGLMAARAAAGADSMNIRIHVPGITPDEVSRQIDELAEVIALMRKH